MGKDAFLNKIAGFQRLLLDTNTIIYFLQGISPFNTILNPLFGLFEQKNLEAVISVITETELLVGPLKAGNQEAVTMVKLFLHEFPGLKVIPVSRQVGQMAAAIRAKTNLRLPDALIIATAKASGCGAIIGNDHTWSKINTPVAAMPEVILLDLYVDG
ncbi:type II toxin-antitoxin system VapC family toxin [Moorella sulfitireducens]|uniref:type II toxin-antitoxin system VapC family toxin n=1 Tax=Neomoorella sulfitireducens TaxID=2972948 RepID=UPI0021AC2726|nr:PIN domain-containing protein [Moorella sulfitireducens]